MFDDIIKKPKCKYVKPGVYTQEIDLCEINEDYEKWIKEYQKLIYAPYIPLVVHDYPQSLGCLADDEHPQYFMEEKPKLQGTWNCEETDLQIFYDEEISDEIIKEMDQEIIENVIKEAQYDIYIKQVNPVEFIVLNFVITRTGVSFTDV